MDYTLLFDGRIGLSAIKLNRLVASGTGHHHPTSFVEH